MTNSLAGLMTDKQKITKGTIYLQGTQSRFHEAITKALNLGSTDGQLTYEISTDLIQSMKNRDIIYRVDYVYYLTAKPTEEVELLLQPAATETGLFSWFYGLWIFFATGWSG